MFRSAAVAALALFSAICLAQRDSTLRAAPITVYTAHESGCPPQVCEPMKAELAAIMAPMGFDFQWRALPARSDHQVSVELVVVSFKGRCEIESFQSPGFDAGPLGWTHMSDGEILPFSDVDCDRVRRFIHPLLTGLNHARRAEKLGRALGRVLAHEVYHILTRDTRHGAGGVAKAYYTPAELLEENFQFEGKETRLLRDGKARAVREAHEQLQAAGGGGGM